MKIARFDSVTLVGLILFFASTDALAFIMSVPPKKQNSLRWVIQKGMMWDLSWKVILYMGLAMGILGLTFPVFDIMYDGNLSWYLSGSPIVAASETGWSRIMEKWLTRAFNDYMCLTLICMTHAAVAGIFLFSRKHFKDRENLISAGDQQLCRGYWWFAFIGSLIASFVLLFATVKAHSDLMIYISYWH